MAVRLGETGRKGAAVLRLRIAQSNAQSKLEQHWVMELKDVNVECGLLLMWIAQQRPVDTNVVI